MAKSKHNRVGRIYAAYNGNLVQLLHLIVDLFF